MGKLPKPLKQIGLIVILVLLTLLVIALLGEVIFQNFYPFPAKISYGVTFSPNFAQRLGLDWQKVYLETLDQLKVRYIRVPTYWDQIEAQNLQYAFSDIDFMLDEAKKRHAKVILVLGARQPRWPECHIPSWAKNLSLKQRQAKILEFIGRVVERYKTHMAILAWQVENEPLLSSFGQGCDSPDTDFLKSEVELVQKINGKPIVITSSGELESWITPMKLSDIFGTTLYRKVYDRTFGYITYPILPYFYNVKSTIVRGLVASPNQKTIISELQAEPWSPKNDFTNMPITQQLSLFSVGNFREYVNYAKQTGFDSAYLWGVEWWFWMGKMGHPQYLEYAKSLF